MPRVQRFIADTKLRLAFIGRLLCAIRERRCLPVMVDGKWCEGLIPAQLQETMADEIGAGNPQIRRGR